MDCLITLCHLHTIARSCTQQWPELWTALFVLQRLQKIGFTTSSQTHYCEHKQDDVMPRINIVTSLCLILGGRTSGNKRERAKCWEGFELNELWRLWVSCELHNMKHWENLIFLPAGPGKSWWMILVHLPHTNGFKEVDCGRCAMGVKKKETQFRQPLCDIICIYV